MLRFEKYNNNNKYGSLIRIKWETRRYFKIRKLNAFNHTE